MPVATFTPQQAGYRVALLPDIPLRPATKVSGLFSKRFGGGAERAPNSDVFVRFGSAIANTSVGEPTTLEVGFLVEGSSRQNTIWQASELVRLAVGTNTIEVRTASGTLLRSRYVYRCTNVEQRYLGNNQAQVTLNFEVQ